MDAHLLLNTLKKEEDKKEKCVKEDTKKSLRDVCMRVCARVYLCVINDLMYFFRI